MGRVPMLRREFELKGETRFGVYTFIKMVLRVFASFDVNRDEDLLKRLLAESKSPDANFIVFDRSSREPATPESEERLRDRISKVDAVLVLCGTWSHRSPNVDHEVKIAQELGIRYYLVKGRMFRDCARPATARIDDKMFKWTRGAVRSLILRNI
jgi:hypothetical protein